MVGQTNTFGLNRTFQILSGVFFVICFLAALAFIPTAFPSEGQADEDAERKSIMVYFKLLKNKKLCVFLFANFIFSFSYSISYLHQVIRSQTSVFLITITSKAFFNIQARGANAHRRRRRGQRGCSPPSWTEIRFTRTKFLKRQWEIRAESLQNVYSPLNLKSSYPMQMPHSFQNCPCSN